MNILHIFYIVKEHGSMRLWQSQVTGNRDRSLMLWQSSEDDYEMCHAKHYQNVPRESGRTYLRVVLSELQKRRLIVECKLVPPDGSSPMQDTEVLFGMVWNSA
jgi:hypothetical protein